MSNYGKMKNVLSLKRATGNPADGIDNFNRSIFGRMDPSAVIFWTKGEVPERGAIRICPSSKPAFILRRADMLWGTGRLHDVPYVLLARLFGRRMPYVVNFHTMMFRGGADAPWKVRTPWFVRKFIFSRADLVICPSAASAKSVQDLFPQKAVIGILNGVELGLFSPEKKNEARLAEKYGIDFSRPVVAFVGSLHERKRPHLFVSLAREIPDANFVAVGRAVPEFDALASAKDLKNFTWIPAMPREDVAALLASSAVFVFPSLNDASAAVILEAMASGAVPIVSASGGSGEFFRDGVSGYLVPHDGNEARAFRGHIVTLLHDPNLRRRMAQAAREEAERHSWDTVAAEYQKAICEPR